MNYDISIIIPTCNRSHVLNRTLTALARQKPESLRFEAIVVDDGAKDDTEKIVLSLEPPFPLRYIKQKSSGAAAARNRGADAAKAPLLLFIDDDMEATPQLVQAHVNAHEKNPGGVVIGYFTAPRGEGATNFLAVETNLWWSHRFSEMEKDYHRFTFQDIFTGNFSIAKNLLISSGKFDQRFYKMAGEDYEIGWRIMKNGARFRFEKSAASFHHDTPSIKRALRRSYAEGRGHVLISKKHPELFKALPLSEVIRNKPWGKFGQWILPRRWVLIGLPWGLIPLLYAARMMKIRHLWRKILGFTRYCLYWQGVYAELNSFSNLQRFINDMPIISNNFVAGELDLESDLGQMETILSQKKVDAVDLRYRKIPIGRIPAVAGAEPLSAAHVKHAIVNQWADILMKAKLRSQSINTCEALNTVFKEIFPSTR